MTKEPSQSIQVLEVAIDKLFNIKLNKYEQIVNYAGWLKEVMCDFLTLDVYADFSLIQILVEKHFHTQVYKGQFSHERVF